MVTVLRSALECALVEMDPAAFPELAELKITLSDLNETTEIRVSMYYDDDVREYRMSTEKTVSPILDEVEELMKLLEDEF